MAVPTSLLMQAAKIVPAVAPQTGGAVDGDWVSLKGYDRCGILVYIDQNNAATTAITVDRATSVAGANVNAGITMYDWWHITNTAIGTDAGTNSDTWTKGAAAASITTSGTGSGASIYYIEVNADDLVAPAGAFGRKYDCLQLKLGASNAANYITAIYILFPPRYAQAVSPLPSAIVD